MSRPSADLAALPWPPRRPGAASSTSTARSWPARPASWGRAARRAGLTTRRQLAGDAVDNVRFRLRGSTDEATSEVRKRVGAFLEGRRVRELERLSAMVLAGVLPRLYPKMLETAY